MLGFRYLLIILFGVLTFPFAQTAIGENLAVPQNVDVIKSSDSQQNTQAVIEWTAQLNQLFDTCQPSEIQFTEQFHKTNLPSAIAYAPKLLYYNIGNAIELHLTSTSIIFPFHCFT